MSSASDMSPRTRQLFEHAARRCLERYGVQLSEGLHGEMVRLVKEGRCSEMRKQTCRAFLVHFHLRFKGEFYAIYDRKREVFVTFLSPEDGAKRFAESKRVTKTKAKRRVKRTRAIFG